MTAQGGPLAIEVKGLKKTFKTVEAVRGIDLEVRAGETFGLGLASTFSELLFTFAPLLVAALVIIRLPANLQLLVLLGYCGVSLLPLLIVGLLIGNRRKLSHIQRWREDNKNFLQFVAGTGLLVLAVYVYVEQVVTVSVAAVGGGA